MSNATKKVILEAESVYYYSHNDETAFFEWLDKLQCVIRYEGEGAILYIEVDPEKVDEMMLRELLALAGRYRTDLKHLGIFCEKFPEVSMGEHKNIYPRKKND